MGFLGTDWLCPEIIAHRAHDQHDLLIAPTFGVGVAQHHLGFPGSLSLRPSTFIAAIEDWVLSLAGHGFDHIYFLNGHGGNVASIEAAFSQIYGRYSFHDSPGAENSCPFRLHLGNWYQYKDVVKLINEFYPIGEGSHATPSEIALTFAAYPDHAKVVELTPQIAPDGPIFDASDYRRRFPDGRVGADSSLARIDHGEALIEAGVANLFADLTAFVTSSKLYQAAARGTAKSQ
jgi:creatinine amidohydrolase/Fe(II)-dependent formamide hydrolase-like protein